jgi:hypothetical protein
MTDRHPSTRRFVNALIVFLVASLATLGILQTSCGSSLNCQDPKNATNVACVVEGAVVDCTGVTSISSAVSVVTPIVEKLVASATQSDGSIQWSSIEQQLVNLALQYGMCVVAEVWNQLMSPPAPGSGGGAGSGSGSALVARRALPSASLAAAFDRIRARVAPGRKFKISAGTL